MDEALIVLGEDEYSARRDADAPRRSIPAKAFYAFTAALSLWVFVYGSGLFPYLGSADIENTSAPPFGGEPGYSISFGLGTMLLFEGQTAFYEYESTSDKSEITFDVKPLTVLGYSENMHRVRGKGSGTIEIPITKTGLYNFRQGPALGRPYGKTAYTVSWGAR